MIFATYLQKQLDRYEQGMTSDAVYRMASHIQGQFDVLSGHRLREYDLGRDFSEQEKQQVVRFCKELLDCFP
jgi:hypothetical protein